MTMTKTLREILMQLSGFASMCWKPIPKGVFDSDRAIKGAEDAISSIQDLRLSEEELRTIIHKHTSEMLDNPDKCGIYPTGKFYNNLIEAIWKAENERFGK